MEIQLHVVTINPQQALSEKTIDRLSEETNAPLVKNENDKSFYPNGDQEFEERLKDLSDEEKQKEFQLYVENKYKEYKKSKDKTVASIPLIVHLPTFIKKYPEIQVYVEGQMVIDITEAKF